ncbi:MAG: 50S ribosomal protein L23 [Alphaproteobacteria bacterium]
MIKSKSKETKTKKKETKGKKPPVSEKIYGLLLSPVITEKATLGSEHNQITFRVPLKATKPEIKDAVEKLFDVKVVAVNTLRQQGKVKRFRGQPGRRAAYKKAMVTLAEGHTVDVTTGI